MRLTRLLVSPPRWLVPVFATLLVTLLAIGTCGTLRNSLFPAGRTTITHSVVVERVRSVAKLATSESTVRDVVIFENTRYGSTKKSLVVVTGKVLVGYDLETDADVDIDHGRRRIRIALPPASILAVDILDMRTYDESRGLWNPFAPADRDAIYRQARAHITSAALQMGAKEHADQSARAFLQSMFAVDGYAVEVVSAVDLVPSAVERGSRS